MRNASPERIVQLVDSYIQVYDSLRASKQFAPYFKGAYMNKAILYLAVKSTVHDLDRLSEYHDIKIPDRHKRAGFLAHRLAKHKPIQIKDDGEKADVDIGLMYIASEVFAIYAAALHLKGIPKQPFPLTKMEFQALVYTLLYRNVDGSSLAIIFHFIEQASIARFALSEQNKQASVG